MKDKLFQKVIDTYKWLALRHTLGPRAIEVETTKVCNLKCPGCRRNYQLGTISSESGVKHLTPGELWKAIETTNIQYVRFEGDGEPTCNPNLKDMVKLCHRLGIRSMMTTNGTLLDKDYIRLLEENGMTRIHVSFDGATKETYEKIRVGADYDRVLHNCKLIGESKIQLFMSVVFFSDEVIEELPLYVDLAKEAGATGIHYMKMQRESLKFGIPPDFSKHTGILEGLRDCARKKGLLVVGTCTEEPTFTPCYDPFIQPYILLNGDVYACTYLANLRRQEVYMGKELKVPYQNYKMGSLRENSMREIWFGTKYQELRKELKRTRYPRGRTLAKEELLKLKEELQSVKDFSYCQGCLARWGESGL